MGLLVGPPEGGGPRPPGLVLGGLIKVGQRIEQSALLHPALRLPERRQLVFEGGELRVCEQPLRGLVQDGLLGLRDLQIKGGLGDGSFLLCIGVLPGRGRILFFTGGRGAADNFTLACS